MGTLCVWCGPRGAGRSTALSLSHAASTLPSTLRAGTRQGCSSSSFLSQSPAYLIHLMLPPQPACLYRHEGGPLTWRVVHSGLGGGGSAYKYGWLPSLVYSFVLPLFLLLHCGIQAICFPMNYFLSALTRNRSSTRYPDMSSEEPSPSGFPPLGLRARLEEYIGIRHRVQFAASCMLIFLILPFPPAPFFPTLQAFTPISSLFPFPFPLFSVFGYEQDILGHICK